MAPSLETLELRHLLTATHPDGLALPAGVGSGGLAVGDVHGVGKTDVQVANVGGLASHSPSTSTSTASPTPAPIAGDGPTVVSVRRFGFHNQTDVLVLQFSRPLDPVRAENVGNYLIRNFKSRPVSIASAAYDPATQTVTLRAGQRIPLYSHTQLAVIGTSPNGLTDTAGNLLDGTNTGQPGSNFSTFLTRRSLAGPSLSAARSSVDPANVSRVVRHPAGLDSTAAVDAALEREIRPV